ncbi:MAG: hypothetical protein ABMA64_31335 [Myxococcota bacterium]
MIWLALTACTGEPPGGHHDQKRSDPVELSAVRQLARASLDIRGVRPTRDEVAAVEADPDALAALVEGFLADPRFEDQVLANYQEAFLTRLEDLRFYDYAAVYDLMDDPDGFVASAGEEPLRIMARIAVDDLPYDLAVTGDFTVIDDRLAGWFPTDRPADTQGWATARYTDGRPAAGVLASNGLWWRYPSTASNKQRKRANVASKLFVCRDFLKTPVTFDNDVNLLDEEALNDAIRTNPSCKACHDDLEPIAAYFWGFDFEYDAGFLLADGLRYHAESERTWEDLGGIPPGWYGAQGTSLADLGPQLLRDPDFDPCAVQHVYQHLLRRPLIKGEDDDAITEHTRAFRQGGRTIRSIWRSVLQDPRYLGVVDDGVTGMPRKVMTPDLLRSAVRDLTGFDWTIDGATQLDHELDGVTTLAGGIDGSTVTVPAHEPNSTMLLVQDQVATGAAAYAVSREKGLEPSERRLFRDIDFTEFPDTDPEAVTTQIVHLYVDVLGRSVAPDGPEVEALLALWTEVDAIDGRPETSWKAVLAALLRDPDFVTY